MKKVLILGGKGTASVIANSMIHANNMGYNEYEFAGFLDDREKEVDGLPVIGKFSDVQKFINNGFYFIYTVFKMGIQDQRIKLFESLSIPDHRLCTFTHPLAYIAPSAIIGPGSVVLAHSTVSPMTKIGKCCLVLNNVSIAHDNIIGDYVKFTPNCAIGADLVISNGAWFGINCTVRGKLTIGENSIIGIGAVLTKNVGSNEIWVGNPARFHKKTTENIAM